MRARSAAAVSPVPGPHRHDQLKRALAARRRSITGSVKDRLSMVRAEHAGGQRGAVLDEGETSDVNVQQDIDLALVQLKIEMLDRIDETIARLDAGAYGRCAECGDEISAARLRALPFAARCLECQGAREAAAQQERASQRRVLPFGDAALREP